MKIKVCDSLCGSGKTMACINMFKKNKKKRYLYVTPYLTEITRVLKSAQANIDFATPRYKNDDLCTDKKTKTQGLKELLMRGENIATTHALFNLITGEIRDLIKKKGYTLVLDEVINVFNPVTDASTDDLEILIRSNTLTSSNGTYVWEDENYGGGMFSNLRKEMLSKDLYRIPGGAFLYSMPINNYTCFTDVYILTYLFRYQIQYYYFLWHGFDIEYIGTRRDGENYEFCSESESDRKKELRDKITILDNPKMNCIGDNDFSLSASWYDRAKVAHKPLEELKKNLHNYFANIMRSSSELNMWTTFKPYEYSLRGKGYSKGFVTFNQKSSNEFIERRNLAFCINVYPQVWEKTFLENKGVDGFNEDMYALSTLVQWLFRSAIRKENSVNIYIPSNRMRFLLTKWMDNLAEGRDMEPITFNYTGRQRRSVKSQSKDSLGISKDELKKIFIK